MTAHQQPAITQDFAGRSALVTGAASGIGKACAEALAARGASNLYLVDMNDEGLGALDLPCTMHRIAGSVADPGLWSDLESTWDSIDHAVVNAGLGSGGQIAELDFAEWRRVMDVNLDGAFLTLAASMRAMKDKGGSVVLVSSTTGLKPIAGIGPYGVSKAAVAHMARIAALEGAPDNIRVNAIAPGGVDTAIWDSSDDFTRSVQALGREATLAKMATTTPNRRFASPAEMANTIAFMLSDAGSNITGHVMVSDGGFTL
jgi:NAD(P)-dependent dehydrogenase (short-subunit alcohol dehydrogenase family)